MKKRFIVPLAALLCLMLLAGCRTAAVPGISTGFSGEEFSKAQKIVVADADGAEQAVLTEAADIEAFVETMDVAHWHMTELPEGLTPSGTVTLWQEETVTVILVGRETKTWEICTFQCYEGGDYLTIDTGLAGISITFSIPQAAADYLRGFWE